jgi:hypothetical protein
VPDRENIAGRPRRGGNLLGEVMQLPAVPRETADSQYWLFGTQLKLLFLNYFDVEFSVQSLSTSWIRKRWGGGGGFIKMLKGETGLYGVREPI